MHIIRKTDQEHEIDMTNDEEYILSLKIGEHYPPIVTPVGRTFDAVKTFLLESSDDWRSIKDNDDTPDVEKLLQRGLIQAIMVGIVQCIERAGDVELLEKIKNDEETKFLFINKENGEQHGNEVNRARVRQDDQIDIGTMFKSNKLPRSEASVVGGKEVGPDADIGTPDPTTGKSRRKKSSKGTSKKSSKRKLSDGSTSSEENSGS